MGEKSYCPDLKIFAGKLNKSAPKRFIIWPITDLTAVHRNSLK